MVSTSMQSRMTLEERIDGMMRDSEDILHKITKLKPPKGRPIEIVTELPAALCVDIIVGNVQRWSEIQKHFDRELRVYAWSVNPIVEKYVQNLVCNMDKVLVTTLPMYVKGDVYYV
ncbi:MAG: hypothetical protein NC548_11440 [Lachnospiraceae bacterium]|nr:hypothetical protein [Lachnospiraceae bacterium]MCM1234719.1 hypothetical protein [Ruminococcus flavefaciens]